MAKKYLQVNKHNYFWTENPFPSFIKKIIRNKQESKAQGYDVEIFNSDEFTTIHNGKHILFSGCSNTLGVGISREELWAYKTYLKISNKEKCSGFFNLGIAGIGIDGIVINLFKYFNQYGNPDAIFLNIPNQLRSISYNDLKGTYSTKHYDDDNIKDALFFNYYFYFILEQYCYSNKIELYSFTWNAQGGEGNHIDTSDIFKEYNFNTFYFYEYKDLLVNMMKIKDQELGSTEFFETARDGHHFGTGYHAAWSEFIYEKYKNNKIN